MNQIFDPNPIIYTCQACNCKISFRVESLSRVTRLGLLKGQAIEKKNLTKINKKVQQKLTEKARNYQISSI